MNPDTNTDTVETYMLDDQGKLFRKGQHIGDLKGDVMQLLPDKKNFAASVTRWLRERADAQDAKGKDSGEEPTPAPVKKLTPVEQEEADNKGIAKEAQEEAAKARALYQDDVAFAKRTGCPEPPKKNPQFGDKTPAFVEWLHKYRHDEYTKRFGVKGRGQVPVIATNPETGIDEVTGYRESDMATRKTHLTEMLETNRGLAEDMDWNA